MFSRCYPSAPHNRKSWIIYIPIKCFYTYLIDGQRPLYPYIQSYNYDIEGFADDHQLFKSFLPVFQTEVLGSGINDCLQNASRWMDEYFLKLSKVKTKILVLAPPSILSQIEINGIFTENTCIRFVSCAKNLGVWIDENLNFTTHVRKVVSSSFMVIRAIAKIKSFALWCAQSLTTVMLCIMV